MHKQNGRSESSDRPFSFWEGNMGGINPCASRTRSSSDRSSVQPGPCPWLYTAHNPQSHSPRHSTANRPKPVKSISLVRMADTKQTAQRPAGNRQIVHRASASERFHLYVNITVERFVVLNTVHVGRRHDDFSSDSVRKAS